MMNAQANCLYYLKQYISMLDQEDLDNFLGFVTGCSVMPRQIDISFTTLTGETRHPIAHTCSNLLDSLLHM